ncbi:MAG: FAD-binding protein [Ruminococcaceae bacterium]|nr:FAD-binding protein [Oscillospiraceae bacterium]
MELLTYEYWGSIYKIPSFSYHTLIVGTGAAGFNAADTLYNLGVTDIAILTEGVNMGTSRNTGSDKQTYYKLTLAGGMPDSVRGMAETLFHCGSMHGDIALCEAAGSAGAFFKLVSLGVPFPANEMGEYVGYKTDHDPAMRATSCGPLTSKLMTEALEKSVRAKNIPIVDGCRVIRLLTDESDIDTTRSQKIAGCAALCDDAVTQDNPMGLCFFLCENLIWAAGGPSAIYQSTVYPESQTCAHGALFLAGVKGASLTESQYGIASTKFRWNLSGTYQQVLPRYISVDKDGVEREFLNDYFPDPAQQLTAIFLKGYEWPFDPRKIYRDGKRGSSAVDLAVFAELQKGRRVFLDFTRNPSCADRNGKFDFSLLEETPLAYLSNSGALLDTPIARLQKMNPKAIALYADHAIDLTAEPLEIAVCAQHNNGGIAVDADWQTSIAGLYCAGEAAGTFGICRPGGTALNSTQVGSARAARHIADQSAAQTPAAPTASQSIFAALHANGKPNPGTMSEEVYYQSETVLQLTAALLDKTDGLPAAALLSIRDDFAAEMTRSGAFLRHAEELGTLYTHRRLQLAGFFSVHRAKDFRALKELFIDYDILLTQYVYIGAMLDYLRDGGTSRGSAVYTQDSVDVLLAAQAPQNIDTAHAAYVQETVFDRMTGEVTSTFVPVRPIPDAELWFETVYNRRGK